MSSTYEQLSEKYLIFSILNDNFGLRIDQLKEVFQSNEILKLPKTSEVLSGITNLRGYILSIFDLSVLLWGPDNSKKEKKVPKSVQHNILVVTIQGQDIGILVDEIRRIEVITEFLAPDTSFFEGKEFEDSSLITKIGVLNDNSNVLIINPENALGSYFTTVKAPDETKQDEEDFDFDFDQYTLPDDEAVDLKQESED
jgi:purine-binding chemotaxis protein CheW